jgi:cellulose synthase/poly-beta-1,6-N-acetylglucosamine synthase-like glycosyltransferase
MTVPSMLVWAAIGVPVFLFGYAYFLYPILLWILGRLFGKGPLPSEAPEEWPVVSISVPVYNEGKQIRELIETLLALEYPRDRLQILIASDASSDETDEVAASYSDRGIELLRAEERGGKTKVENMVLEHLRGEIIVNTDASIRIPPESLKELVKVFSDPEIGLASGRDISVARTSAEGNVGESSYVGYEMAVRDLETRLSGIVGASGCFYAIRSNLHQTMVPESLSRDFAAALHTRENGYRPVSVPKATCFVPRSGSIRQEFKRKIRTITRGMETLYFKKALLNPFRFATPAWMLLSHKISRWLFPWFGLAFFAGIGLLALQEPWALGLFLTGLVVLILAAVGWLLGNKPNVPRVFSIPAFFVVGNLAAALAFIRFLVGNRDPIWEPTRR